MQELNALVSDPAGVAAQVLRGNLEHSEGVCPASGRDAELARGMQQSSIELPQDLRSRGAWGGNKEIELGG